MQGACLRSQIRGLGSQVQGLGSQVQGLGPQVQGLGLAPSQPPSPLPATHPWSSGHFPLEQLLVGGQGVAQVSGALEQRSAHKLQVRLEWGAGGWGLGVGRGGDLVLRGGRS